MIEQRLSEWIDVTDFKLEVDSWLDLFHEKVKQYPDKIAVYSNAGDLTYKQLNNYSNWYAAKVSEFGSASPFVGLSAQRTPQMLAAMIGIQKSGKAYLPVDVSFPENRISHMITDSGIDIIISDSIDIFNKIDDSIRCIDITKAESEAEFNSETLKSDNFAYILYTSGSTGLPKGVVVQHGAFLNFLLSMKESPGCTLSDVVLALTTISFDISGLELFLPLICGASVWINDSNAVYDPEGIAKLITESEITVAQTTASVWKLILDAGFKGKTGLRILCGGEYFPPELAARLYATGCEIWNMYGPTEATIWSSVYKITTSPDKAPPIGMPIANTGFHILNENCSPVEKGETGSLWISGEGLAYGYWNNIEKTNSVFVDSKYNTGDLVYEDEDGNIAFVGRSDNQLKLRGMRLEAGEIEKALISHKSVKDAVVLVREDHAGNQFLAAFLLLAEGAVIPGASELRKKLNSGLPEYMIPSAYQVMEKFPMTLNNKINRNAFPEIVSESFSSSKSGDKDLKLAEIISELWAKALNHSDFNIKDNFFDVGGHSFLLIQVAKELSEVLGKTISPLMFFENPTIAQLCEALGEHAVNYNSADDTAHSDDEQNNQDSDDFAVAIIGMSCAVPGASNVEEFWELLKNGKSGIREYTDEELLSEGISEEVINNPDYVKKSGYLASSRTFDNDFFGYSPNEAKFMDPQHRLMLEHSYKALESAGIDPFDYDGRIGIYAGSSRNKYLLRNIMFSSAGDSWSDFQTMIGNDNDFLASRVAYKLNLRGPAMTIQTACSTSLVAIQTAYQSLLNYQCDAALCGGVSVNVPEMEGYEYTEGAIFSKDGICRAFDKGANGTIFGSGVGVVLLKRLSDAIADGDPIVAVIRGAAINNDGYGKVGYTAPSVNGQAEVIHDALELADVSPDVVSYVEAHGTGTILGDPIELEGLKKAFGNNGKGDNPCYIGSVKTNIGHLDAAAGVSSLIKTALSLKNKQIPASLNFNEPNPGLNIEQTRFEVNSKLREWEPIKERWVAGVSAFGIGGTNAHVVLEAFETKGKKPQTSSSYLIYPVTAKSEEAQNEYLNSIADFINRAENDKKLNTAYTLMNGRHSHDYRGFLISSSKASEMGSVTVKASKPSFKSPEPVLVFPGQGTQYPGMSKELYDSNSVYREYLDECFSIIYKMTGWDSKTLLFNEEHWRFKTEYTQPFLFSVEYSIAKMFIDYGLECNILTGHSLGEFPAACIAGAYSLEDGIRLVINRGRIMAKAEHGAMLAVFSSYDEIKHRIIPEVDIAGINAENQVVFSGAFENIKAQQKVFESEDIVCRVISEESAFHSRLMDSILDEFKESLSDILFKPITKSVISNLEGELLEPGYLYSAEYWCKQLRSTVKFFDGITSLKNKAELVFIEAGPGAVLSKLIRAIHSRTDKTIIQTLPPYGSDADEYEFFLKAFGNMWKAGLPVDIEGINNIKDGRRIDIPVYPFLKKEHWVVPDKVMGADSGIAGDESSSYTDTLKPQNVADEMKSVWSTILGYEEILPEHNFFNLGGDSLLAAELVKKINNTFSIKMSIKELILYPLFKDLSKYVEENQSADSSYSNISLLFPVNKTGNRPILFLVAGAHGNNYFSADSSELKYEEDFMRYLSSILNVIGPEQPLYSFRPKGIFYGEKMHGSVEEMASLYISEMKKIQPEGPYFIGGECVGGLVAYEMAQQLTAQGEKVSNLLLMDTPKSSTYRKVLESIVLFRRRVKGIIKSGFAKDEIKSFLLSYFSFTEKRREIRDVEDSSRFYLQKLLSYKPKRNICNTTLIINHEWNIKYNGLRWDSEILPNMEIYEVPGDHSTRLSKYGHISGNIIKSVSDKISN